MYGSRHVVSGCGAGPEPRARRCPRRRRRCPGGHGGPRYTAGAAGAGDAYFPFAGNGGYDVIHYDLDITYTPPGPAPAPLVGQLEGVATIDLVATQDLDRFNLDLRGMDVRAITINGKRASEVATPADGTRSRDRPTGRCRTMPHGCGS